MKFKDAMIEVLCRVPVIGGLVRFYLLVKLLAYVKAAIEIIKEEGLDEQG